MIRHARFGAALATMAAALFVPALAPGSPEPTFESHWQDGRAELTGYQYHITRYGESRTGQAVMITVTEPFSESKRVKADHPDRNPADAIEALKVNLVRDFQTGIYDYNTMTSLFVRSRDFTPMKISFSSAEWCGHVYEELRFDRDGVRQSLRSYFEGESGDRSLNAPPSGISEDQLFVLVRGLRGDYLKPGEKRTTPFLPSSIVRRLVHQPLAWTSATIERAAKPERLNVPAGSFLSDQYQVKTADARVGTFWVERAYPHRIVRWSWSSAARGDLRAGEAMESAELAGSIRLPYWQLHGNGQESYLREIGLSPLPSPIAGSRRGR